MKNNIIMFAYKIALILAFNSIYLLQNNFCEFTKHTYKFKKVILNQNKGLNASFKDF